MANITFTEGSGLNDSIYGKSQAPIRMFIEKRGEAFEQQSMLPELFAMEKSTHFSEKYTSLTAMEGFKPVGENGAYPVDGMQEGYDKVFEHMTWKDSFSISREMVDDGKLVDLKKKPAAFIKGYYRTREKFGAALYAGAVSGDNSVDFGGRKFSTKTADGKNLFHTKHISKVTKNEQSNMFSDEFSADALAAMECAMQNIKGDNDEVLDVAPDTILIPNEYGIKKAVFAAIGADKDPDTANNGFNYIYGRWNVIVWPYFNQFLKKGLRPWMVLDSEYNKEYGGAVWLDRVELEVKSILSDENDANKWLGYSRFSAGFNDWRFAACGGLDEGTVLIG